MFMISAPKNFPGDRVVSDDSLTCLPASDWERLTTGSTASADNSLDGARYGQELSEAAEWELVERCANANLALRSEGVSCLTKIVPVAGSGLLAKIVSRIELATDEPAALEGLVSALTAVASPGDACAVATLIKHSQNSACWVRLHCVVGLGALAAYDDEGSLAAVVGCAGDGSWQVRQAAAEALANIAGPKGAATASRTLSHLLEDTCAAVRKAACPARQQVAALEAGVPSQTRAAPPSRAARTAMTRGCKKELPCSEKKVLGTLAGAAGAVAVFLLVERLLKKP